MTKINSLQIILSKYSIIKQYKNKVYQTKIADFKKDLKPNKTEAVA